jgi:epoxyqueuosine reductase
MTTDKSVLVHVCCAHCAAYTVDYWRGLGYAVSAYWYNPNIHPFLEHQHRLDAMRTLAAEMDVPLIVEPGYDMVDYFRAVVGHEDDRCRHCFDQRLTKTAAIAAGLGIASFTSTLLISPHQEHEILREVGEETAAGGVGFLYADLRKRYSDSRHMTKPLDIYRQQYCGCVYSEWERYRES